jgi:hypothetical protein
MPRGILPSALGSEGSKQNTEFWIGGRKIGDSGTLPAF